MPLSAGDKLGPYEILARIGEGGMGQVWRARDTRLDRIVAIKTSHAKFSERFEREARAVAALNHPHICALYDVGPDYLVMEYVEGTEVKGPLPLDQALKYAIQLASALEAAHRKLITHRDLKPANIMITKAGVKVLDFGLARMDRQETAHSLAENEETLTRPLTQEGSIVGTLQYMAPEQVQGRMIDTRADVFSFGCVLYEMLTGKRAFDGANTPSVIAAILERPAPSVGSVAPPALDWVLHRCLAKDPDERWQSVRDVRAELERIAEGGTEIPAEAAKQPDGLRWKFRLALAAAGVFALAAGWLAFVHFREALPVVHSELFAVQPPAETEFTDTIYSTAISPDGRYIVFAAGTTANSSLWLRPMNSLDARPMPGTEGGRVPFWSPDGESIGFYAGGKLKRSSVGGGVPQELCDATAINTSLGGTWSRNGIILFAQGGGLFRISASGGAPLMVTQIDNARKEAYHAIPQFLPDGKRFLYFVRSEDSAVEGIYVASLDHPGDRARILATQHKAYYAPPLAGRTGFLIWLRGRTLLAQPFDEKNLHIEGEASPIADNVDSPGATTAAFWTSDTGLLAYRSAVPPKKWTLLWMSRDGRNLGDAAKEDTYGQFQLSPDGHRLATTLVSDSGALDVWVLEFGRDVLSRLTFTGMNKYDPWWSPDGRKIAYDSSLSGIRQLYSKDASGAGPEERLTNGPNNKGLSDWSRDGRYLLYQDLDPKTGFDIWALPLEGERKPFPVLRTPFSEVLAKFSPDGKWIAYTSDESGGPEVYVRAFPVSSGQWQVSNRGGNAPHWRADGKELYFLEEKTSSMMAAGIRMSGASVQTDTPHKLFPIANATASYDVTADGQRFLIRQPTGAQHAPPPLTVVLNWQAELKK